MCCFHAYQIGENEDFRCMNVVHKNPMWYLFTICQIFLCLCQLDLSESVWHEVQPVKMHVRCNVWRIFGIHRHSERNKRKSKIDNRDNRAPFSKKHLQSLTTQVGLPHSTGLSPDWSTSVCRSINYYEGINALNRMRNAKKHLSNSKSIYPPDLGKSRGRRDFILIHLNI